MKNTILIKRHQSVQLAHLYEHLFLMEVNELLNQRGLFKWLDFTLNGTTFDQGGVIVVDFRAYTKAAADCLPDILQLRLNFDDAIVAKALMQIHAEEVYELKVGSLDAIRRQFVTLNSAEWQNLDQVEVTDTKYTKRASNPLRLSRTESGQPITTKVSLELDKQYSDEDLLARVVFGVMARFILITATYDVANKTGSYSFQLYTQLSGRRVAAELLTAFLFRSQAPDMQDVVKQVQDTIANMRNRGAFKRLASDLQNTSYYHNGTQAPDYELILKDAGVLVGSRGWRMVDEKYIENVLKYVSIEVRRSHNFVRISL